MKTVYATIGKTRSSKVIECNQCYEVRFYRCIGMFRTWQLVDYSLELHLEQAKDTCYEWSQAE